ncbi:PREDICTED: LOW QUALITY PROTEIN: cell surface glycoprotein CD200 receptor 1-like [Condylura cristata]|uniref:LOW QUALITY PROTEIN: cell surface glycoprotein CD200 receptor 1-like n=1 Tax=Condylura cristata TaxID=143302 RepID=UPI0006429C87|nr:PREDICTED: LOW QUALITY PROTEIN: cell surface glycoprotein CD200 receptor 1-like [Condylura cristata]
MANPDNLSSLVTLEDYSLSSKDEVDLGGNNSHLVTQIQNQQMKVPSESPAEANRPQPALEGTKVVFCCPPVQGSLMLVTWIIFLRNRLPCTKVYREDRRETKEGNCSDPRITWISGRDQNPAVQIDPVSLTHDGNYTCELVTAEGNFRYGYHLQVSVPPKVSLDLGKNRTTVCKAVAGKPAARISWTPGGDCVTEEEPWDNDTVTVQSTCHWAEGDVSAVYRSVFHLTGNKSLSIELSQVQEKAFDCKKWKIELWMNEKGHKSSYTRRYPALTARQQLLEGPVLIPLLCSAIICVGFILGR